MKRLFKLLCCAAAALCLCLLALPVLAQSYAEPGDYDEIKSYTVTVDPRADGSADITYDIHWQVVGGGDGDYLSWVKIGLANAHADDFRILTADTIQSLDYSSEGGSYARVDFYDRYYAPGVAAQNGAESSVHFAFTVHQSHLFTRNADETASFAFTPGWFDDIVIDEMTVRWKNYDGVTADNTGTEGDYLTWCFGPLEHGEVVTVNVTVPVLAAAGFDDSAAMTSADLPGGPVADPQDRMFLMLLLVLLVVVLAMFFTRAASSRWRGGFGNGADEYVYYSDGVHVVHLLPHEPPPAGYQVVSRPAGYKPGGGSTRGGGASRRSSGSSSHSSCACACASSCACACACAGGGRAGCSAKNFYRITIKANSKQEKEA